MTLGQVPAERVVTRPLGLLAAPTGIIVVAEAPEPQILQGRYGEVLYPFPETASLGPGNDAWVDYVERKHDGITYRSFKDSDPLYGEVSDVGFPSSGSAPYNFSPGRFSEKDKTSD